MWSYIYFALHLDTMHPNDHNALEKYVYDNVRNIYCSLKSPNSCNHS